MRDERVAGTIDDELEGGLLWPEPLVQLNPSFAPGGTIDELVAEGTLHPTCAQVFRVGKGPGADGAASGTPIGLYRHQAQAIRTAHTGANYVLTTGTGSGKSLAYIIPIVDHVLRAGQVARSWPI